MDKYKHFVLVVAGNDPVNMVKPFSYKKGEKKYTAFKFSEREKYKKQYIAMLTGLLDDKSINEQTKEVVKNRIDYYTNLDAYDFYNEITDDYEIDEETGDALTDKDPNGKYDSCNKPTLFAVPLLTKDGKETFSTLNGEIDWEQICNKDKDVYEFAWDSVMCGKKATTDDEKAIYENMKNRKAYFENYGTRENYVESNTAFWGYAFLSDETGWVELNNSDDQYEWVKNFYKRFIEPQSDDTLISIFECTRLN